MKCKCGKTDHPGMTATSIYRVGIIDHMIDKCEPPVELPGSSLNPGRKDDGGKTRYDLLPWRGLILVAMVMTHGAAKYAPDNWRKVEG